MDWSTSSRAAQHLGVMSDSGEQNYGERVRRGGGGGGCMIPASFVFPGPSASDRSWAIWAAKSGQQNGSQFKRPSRVVSLVVKEAPGRLLWSRTRVGRFFRYKGGLKMAAASPWCWGRGEVSFLRCSPTKARRSHLGLAGWARRQRHKMADEPRVDAGLARASAGGGGKRKATCFRVFQPVCALGKDRPTGPGRIASSVLWGLLLWDRGK